ncbi:MAG: arginine--tRNA ligase [Candidatus Saccharimonadales bacterium]
MDKKIAQIIADLFGVETDVVLTRPDSQFGDYSTNVALQLAKQVGQSPRDVADQIANKLTESGDFEKVDVAGPGFINITLSGNDLIDLTRLGPTPIYAGKTIVFEYSCPNAFKELHTGHLYQTIYGDIVGRLMLVGGAQLHRTSFGGDVGLHVAKCLWGMVATLGGEIPERLANEVADDPFVRAHWISNCYVRGASAYEENEQTKNDIDELNKTIYGFHDSKDHESPLAQIYWTTRQWSYDYFAAFYELIDVESQQYYPESATAPTGLAVVREQLKKGILKVSEGAVVFEGDESKNLHTRVFITSKGLPTYETKDIGVIWQEREDYHFDHRYIITGNDQKEYMRVVFAAAEAFDPTLTGTMTHMTNGTVRFGDGKKMSSRLGNVSRAIDVVDAVREKVTEIVDDKSIVEDVTLGAIKYVFAKYRLGGDIAFDIDETVSLQGNSGPYLQYAHARARRILEKIDSIRLPTEVHDEDRMLIRKIGEYHEIVELAIQALEPHHICNYLFELAQEFNRYYEKNQVVGNELEMHRAGVVSLYADTLKSGLMILGIATPNKM